MTLRSSRPASLVHPSSPVHPSSLALAVTVVLWASAFPAIRIGLDHYGVAGLSFCF